MNDINWVDNSNNKRHSIKLPNSLQALNLSNHATFMKLLTMPECVRDRRRYEFESQILRWKYKTSEIPDVC